MIVADQGHYPPRILFHYFCLLNAAMAIASRLALCDWPRGRSNLHRIGGADRRPGLSFRSKRSREVPGADAREPDTQRGNLSRDGDAPHRLSRIQIPSRHNGGKPAPDDLTAVQAGYLHLPAVEC